MARATAAVKGAGAAAAQAGPRAEMHPHFRPGQEMQTKGSVTGRRGASGYATGRQMQAKGSLKGRPGASGYAPGQRAKSL